MSDANAIEQATPSPRLPDLLWSTSLVLAIIGLLVGALGGAGAPARWIGVLGLGLAVATGALAFKAQRRLLLGALLALGVSLFTVVVGGRPTPTPTLRLQDGAPRYVVASPEGVEDAAMASRAPKIAGVAVATNELENHPGPVTLSASGLLALSAAQFVASALVAADWDDAWYAGRVLSVDGNSARVHFIGWENEWDELMPRDRLRALSDSQLPSQASLLPPNTLGGATALPCSMIISVFQPASGFAEGMDMNGAEPTSKLYSQRLDVSDAPLGSAMPSIAADKPFGMVATAAMAFGTGPYFFALASDGANNLWVDGKPVTGGVPVNLTAGVHQVRVEYRHPAGPKMTLGLRVGTDPKALRILDMNRFGVAQVANERDGNVRLVLAEGVLFDLDKDELNASAEAALSSIFQLTLAAAPAAHVKVEGHTDDSGSDEHNLDLSRHRAERVRSWLLLHGRDDGTVTSEGFGEKRPRVPNDSEANRRANRRVELILSGLNGAAAPAAGATAPPKGSDANQAVSAVIHAYYGDLNAGTFDANRYFEPNVQRYITMMNTTTAAMNHYIQDIFPKQFRERHFEMVEDTLVRESPGQYVYVEHSRYIVAGKKQSVEKRVQVRIQVSPNGKLVFLQQFHVLQ